MAPKGNKGKKTPSNNDPAYAEKRKRNNDVSFMTIEVK